MDTDKQCRKLQKWIYILVLPVAGHLGWLQMNNNALSSRMGAKQSAKISVIEFVVSSLVFVGMFYQQGWLSGLVS